MINGSNVVGTRELGSMQNFQTSCLSLRRDNSTDTWNGTPDYIQLVDKQLQEIKWI